MLTQRVSPGLLHMMDSKRKPLVPPYLISRTGHRRRIGGFTLVELMVAINTIAVLIGMLLPAIQKVDEAARRLQVQHDLKQLYVGMEKYWDAYGVYPTVIIDPAFLEILVDCGFNGLVSRINWGIDYSGDTQIYEPPNFPYYVLSVRQGTPGDQSTWDFRIAAGIGPNPLYVHYDSAIDALFDEGYAIDSAGQIGDALIYRFYGELNLFGEGGPYEWSWDEAKQVVIRRPRSYPIEKLLLVVRGAEMVAPLLEARPEVAGRVRSYVNDPGNTLAALSQYSPDWVAPFCDILGFAGADDVPDINPEDVTGDPGLLFSYESLRMLTTFYSADSGVTDALIAKIDAAEDAENRGNLTARQGQLTAFGNQVRAQTGGALNQQQARTLAAIAGTL